MEITLKFSSPEEMNDFIARFRTNAPEVRPAAEPEPVPEAPAPEPVPESPAPTGRTYTMDELGAVMSTLIDAGKMDQVRAAILEFGVPAINELDPARYPEFAEKLTALGGEFNG